jgi:hypothetical protein
MDARMAKLRGRHSKEVAASYKAFLEEHPEFLGVAHEPYENPEHDDAWTAYTNESGIMQRHQEERKQLADVLRAERAPKGQE